MLVGGSVWASSTKDPLADRTSNRTIHDWYVMVLNFRAVSSRGELLYSGYIAVLHCTYNTVELSWLGCSSLLAFRHRKQPPFVIVGGHPWQHNNNQQKQQTNFWCYWILLRSVPYVTSIRYITYYHSNWRKNKAYPSRSPSIPTQYYSRLVRQQTNSNLIHTPSNRTTTHDECYNNDSNKRSTIW